MVVRVVGFSSIVLVGGVLAGRAEGDAGGVVAAPSEPSPKALGEERPTLGPLDLIGSWLVTEADEERATSSPSSTPRGQKPAGSLAHRDGPSGQRKRMPLLRSASSSPLRAI